MKIKVFRLYRFDNDLATPLKAFVDIVIDDCLIITGLRIVQGREEIFVSMPREQAKDKRWYDQVRFLDKEIKKQIDKVVLEAYAEGSNVENYETNIPSA